MTHSQATAAVHPDGQDSPAKKVGHCDSNNNFYTLIKAGLKPGFLGEIVQQRDFWCCRLTVFKNILSN